MNTFWNFKNSSFFDGRFRRSTEQLLLSNVYFQTQERPFNYAILFHYYRPSLSWNNKKCDMREHPFPRPLLPFYISLDYTHVRPFLLRLTLGELMRTSGWIFPVKNGKKNSTGSIRTRKIRESRNSLAETFEALTRQRTKAQRSLGFCRVIAHN